MSYCNWSTSDAAMIRYHDEEWGVPVHDDRRQFEFLMMEALQCGLSWSLMIRKREIFRFCFKEFDFDAIASFDEKDIERIISTEGMIRSRRKIEAIITNARQFQKIRSEFGSFSDYLWRSSEGKTILYDGHGEGLIPTSNGLSSRISADLKKRGFRFLGPVTIYSHLQAAGIINDHDKNCPCYKRICASYPTVKKKPDQEQNVSDYSKN